MGVTSRVAVLATARSPSTSSVRWSRARMRMSESTVSLARRSRSSFSWASISWVRTTSMRSPGKIRPAMPVVAVTGTEIARWPGFSIAARKPRSPGRTTRVSVIGSPFIRVWRTTAPSKLLGSYSGVRST